MVVALNGDYQSALDENKKEVREMVIAGLEQIKEGKTKDFNSVCDRLEKKYTDEAISNERVHGFPLRNTLALNKLRSGSGCRKTASRNQRA